jgi:hypothetical protein
MNIDVDELIAEIGRLHIQVIVLQKANAALQAQIPKAISETPVKQSE